MQDPLKTIQNKAAEIADFKKTLSLLRWDQEVMMPPKGAKSRSRLTATMSSHLHRLQTNPELEEALNKARDEQPSDLKTRKNVELMLEDIQKVKKMPEDFVYRKKKAISEAFGQWKQAKEEKDFSRFAPYLKKLVDFNLEQSELIGYKEHPYDPHLDNYDKGLTLATTKEIFGRIRDPLIKLIDELQSAETPQRDFLNNTFDPEVQKSISHQIIKDLGYDTQAGRLDVSPHPFTSSFGPGDTRITTRYDDNDLMDGFLSTVHETGHALYDQGLDSSQYGLPAGEPISMAIHESQSRLYENHIARSRPFAEAYFETFKHHFPKALKNVTPDQFFRAINIIEPSLIRTAADELTYHMHIIIRYEIERDLVEEKIKAEEVRDAWNDKYRDYLGVTVPDDSKGVLQDVHWSHGHFGYFPTYSLGSFYAAQFYNKANEQMPDLPSKIQNKDFQPLLSWLRENIHQHGRVYNSNEMAEKVTGEPLNPQHFLDYARKKFREVYGIQ